MVHMAAEEHMEVENPQENAKNKKNNSILTHFNKLTSDKPKFQVKSALSLVKQLTEKHDEKAQQEVKYALGRLIRGLGSSKTQTKTGYFTTLVALFNLLRPTLEDIFAIIDKELHKAGSNSKSENADISCGQLLVCGAILRSNLYETLEKSDKEKVLNLLITAGKERDYLTLASHVFIVDLYAKLSSEEFQQVVFHQIKSEAFKPWQEQNLDTFYLMVQTLKYFPDCINSKFLKNSLGTTKVFSEENLTQICNILIAIPRVTALKHPIFLWLIEELAKATFTPQFFQTLDSHLAKSNRNKQLVFTKILSGVIEKLDDISFLPRLLTENYVQQTIQMFKTNVGKNRDGDFRQNTHALFDTILKRLKATDDDDVKVEVLERLIFYPGTFIFEKVTNTKLVQNITQTLGKTGVERLAEMYESIVSGKESRKVGRDVQETYWIRDRVYAAFLLVKLISHPAMSQTIEWKCQKLTFLMSTALYAQDDHVIGANLAGTLKETFFSALTLRSTKLNDLRAILWHLNTELESNLNELREPLSEEDLSFFQRGMEFAKSLQTKTSKRKLVFSILFLHMNLQLFNNAAMARDTLNELFTCYARAKQVKKNGERSADDIEWIEVVVDLFLNLLSQNSHLLRNVICCVFPHLCQFLNANAIHQILSVLDPENEDNPLSTNKHESSDEEEETDEEESEEEEEEEETNDEEEETNEDETENDRLRLALHQLLGNHVDDDAQSVDLDDLDEEEGEKLDLALSNAFKRFKPNLGRSKKQSKNDQTLTHFRVRVMDLIEIYLNSNPSLILTLEIMLPLLKTLEFSIRDEHQKPLKDRVENTLKKLTNLKKFENCDEVVEATLVELLQSLLDKGTKNTIILQDMANKISECCMFVINCTQLVAKRKKKPKVTVYEVIKQSLITFFNTRDCLIPYVLFKSVMQSNWSGAIDLAQILLDYVYSDSIRAYRKHQAFDLLKLFCKNHRLQFTHKEHLDVLQEPLKKFLQETVNFLDTFCANPQTVQVKETFFNGFFTFLTELKPSKLVESYDWSELSEKIRETRTHVILSPTSKQCYNKLCRVLNVSQQVEMKQSAVRLDRIEEDESVDNAKGDKKRKKKTGGNKETLKLKKESKKLRLEGLSDGLNSKSKHRWDPENGEQIEADDD